MSLTKLREGLNELRMGKVLYQVPAQVMRLCPHLSIDQVDELVVEAHVTGRKAFIGPPTKIRGAEHIYYLTQQPVAGKPGEHDLTLAWGGVHRRKESYVMTEVPDGWTDREFDYREQVADYAEVNWGDGMYWDRGRQLIHLMVCDPERRSKHHYPIVKHSTMLTLSETWINLQGREDRYPLPQLIEQTLELISENMFVNAELMGDVKPMAAYNCIYCGGGLGLEHCHFCRRKVVCKKQGRVDWPYPIPLRVCDELRWMPSFELSPANAMKAYYGNWSVKDYQGPPSSPLESREQRSIVLRDEE